MISQRLKTGSLKFQIDMLLRIIESKSINIFNLNSG